MFPDTEWNDITEEAKDFLRLALNKDPNQRPDAESLLRNKWLNHRNIKKSSRQTLKHIGTNLI